MLVYHYLNSSINSAFPFSPQPSIVLVVDSFHNQSQVSGPVPLCTAVRMSAVTHSSSVLFPVDFPPEISLGKQVCRSAHSDHLLHEAARF